MHLDFQALNLWIDKARQVIAEDGIPGPYVEMLCDLEDLINDTAQDKASLKGMTKTKAKSFNVMKHKVPKLNKAYAAEMKRWRDVCTTSSF